MKTIDYDALIEERHQSPDEIARRRDAARLAEVARNLETLAALADAGAAPPQTPETKETVPPAGAPQGDRA